jgi:hypothetical protein
LKSPHKADIRSVLVDVCFRGNSRHHSGPAECPLMTQLQHAQLGVAAAQNFTQIASTASQSVHESRNDVFTSPIGQAYVIIKKTDSKEHSI